MDKPTLILTPKKKPTLTLTPKPAPQAVSPYIFNEKGAYWKAPIAKGVSPINKALASKMA